MPEKVMPGPVEDSCGIREAVCIHTRKIFDSCRDKDCIEDLRFYPTLASHDILCRAQTVKGGKAELLYTYIDVEPVVFNRGFYTVDMRFFYHVTLQAYLSCPVPVTVEGLCVFDKRAILFGSEGNAKIFSSEMRAGEPDPQMMQRSNTPIAVVEAVDPIVLDARIMDCCCKRDCDCDLYEIPTFVGDCCGEPCLNQLPAGIRNLFDDELVLSGESRRLYVTLGQFSIVRLERDTQLLVPVYDYCMPDKECACGDGCEDPCALFRNISFPVGEFFPPNTVKRPESCDDIKSCCK